MKADIYINDWCKQNGFHHYNKKRIKQWYELKWEDICTKIM